MNLYRFLKVLKFYLKKKIFFTAGRYAITSSNGDLHIRTVKSEDGRTKFSCLTTNTLSGERKISDSVYLSIKGKST